jgi:signal transduction histidine kinase
MVGAPVIVGGANSRARLLAWSVAYAGFGAAFWLSLGRRAASARGPRLALLGAQGACVVAMILLLCDGFEGALLVLVALSLGGLVSRRAGVLWIAAQSALAAGAIAIHWSPRPALLLAPPYLGFQILAFLVADLLARDAEARRELAEANEALLAAQELTEENGRLAERLRIARELHDAIGHHLTALSLNLEVAACVAEGRARGTTAGAPRA